jgi:hypothetical protein
MGHYRAMAEPDKRTGKRWRMTPDTTREQRRQLSIVPDSSSLEQPPHSSDESADDH